MGRTLPRVGGTSFFLKIPIPLGADGATCITPRAGFLGFWWLPAELPDEHRAYLQLEQEKLCFKVWAGDSSTEVQDKLKKHWHERITDQHERVVKPTRMRRGKTMTVAVHECGWLRFDDKGVLNLDRTIESLREAERVLLAASRTS